MLLSPSNRSWHFSWQHEGGAWGWTMGVFIALQGKQVLQAPCRTGCFVSINLDPPLTVLEKGVCIGGDGSFPLFQAIEPKYSSEPQQQGLVWRIWLCLARWGQGSKFESPSMRAGIFLSIKSKAMKTHCGAQLCYNLTHIQTHASCLPGWCVGQEWAQSNTAGRVLTNVSLAVPQGSRTLCHLAESRPFKWTDKHTRVQWRVSPFFLHQWVCLNSVFSSERPLSREICFRVTVHSGSDAYCAERRSPGDGWVPRL